jgi:hypothetical protein
MSPYQAVGFPPLTGPAACLASGYRSTGDTIGTARSLRELVVLAPADDHDLAGQGRQARSKTGRDGGGFGSLRRCPTAHAGFTVAGTRVQQVSI